MGVDNTPRGGMETTEQTGKQPGKRGKAAPADRRMKLNVYRSWCKRCGICEAFCPKGALERDPEGFPRYKDPKLCVACHMCELRCPDFAIEVVEEEGRDDAAK
jgi:2-oxoglutarate ferredoxin oxidoreductase subunit delta